MPVPREFAQLLSRFHQDIGLQASNEEEVISFMLRGLDNAQKRTVRGFLDGLLARNPTGAELQRVWRDGDADWSLRDDDELRQFLTMIRDRLALDAVRPT